MQDIKNVTFGRRKSRAEVLTKAFGTFVFCLFLCALAAVLASGAWHMYTRMAAASTGEEAAQNQLASVQKQKAEVEQNLEQLSTQTGVEGQLRQQYGVAKPGEGVIEIIQAPKATSTDLASPENIFVRIWRIFFP